MELYAAAVNNEIGAKNGAWGETLATTGIPCATSESPSAFLWGGHSPFFSSVGTCVMNASPRRSVAREAFLRSGRRFRHVRLSSGSGLSPGSPPVRMPPSPLPPWPPPWPRSRPPP